MTPALAMSPSYSSTTNATGYTTSNPVVASAGDLLAAFILSYASLANVALPATVVDAGAVCTWRRLRNAESVASVADTPSLATWIAVAPEDFSGALTITYGAQQRGCAVIVVKLPAPSKAEPVRLSNMTASRGTGTGVTSTLAALAAATHLHLYAVSHFANEVTAPGAGFTELDDIAFADAGGSGTNHALEVAYKANDPTADPSWATSSPYAIASIELQAPTVTEPTYQTVYQPTWLVEVESP